MSSSGYLKRLADLDKPLPLDTAWFLPPRPDHSPPEDSGKRRAVKLPTPLTKDEKEQLRTEYYENVKLPASITLDHFPEDEITEVLPGKAWIVPKLLSEKECEEIIELGEQWGLRGDSKTRARTSKRTNDYINDDLSLKIGQRLPEELLEVVENTAPYTSVRGLHPNWRVARYQDGETFAAHIDQADSVLVDHPEKKKQRYTSSHTLLIYLRRRGEQFRGGATRLYTEGTYRGSTTDVCLPQGWGLVFQQKGLLHAGLPVYGDTAKYIAQAGLLRAEPDHVAGAVAVFRYGPGLGEMAEEEIKKAYQAYQG